MFKPPRYCSPSLKKGGSIARGLQYLPIVCFVIAIHGMSGVKMFVPVHKVLVLVHKVFVPVHKILVLVHKVFVLVHKVLVLVHKVLVLVHKVIVQVHKVFVLVHKLFVPVAKISGGITNITSLSRHDIYYIYQYVRHVFLRSF